MSTWTEIALMIYFALVSILGTLGNGIILLAYGNRWNSSRSTSVVFILILACFDLWTCLIVAPIFAVMEYRDFEVPTLLCRFYSFSKCLLISSSLIMSFIALDRFLNIALPHHRLLHPRRVKFLLTLFILIGVGLGILIALAFSSVPYKETYLATYNFVQSEDPDVFKNASDMITLTFKQQNVSSNELISTIQDLVHIPPGANISNINLTHVSTHGRCFADTSIIPETLREILKHITNKCFFTSIGIVTILYAITFILALQRQNPRIRALKKSLHVLNKFNAYSPSTHQSELNSSYHHPPPPPVKQRTDSIGSYLPYSPSTKTKSTTIASKHLSTHDNQQYEMASFINNDDLDDQHVLHTPKQDFPLSVSKATSEDLLASNEKFSRNKQVSFRVENNLDQQQLPFLSQTSDVDSDRNNDTYYRFPCPCSTTRQLLIKFHFAQPTLDINQWLCYCCLKKPTSTPTTDDQQTPISSPIEDEGYSVIPPILPISNNSTTNHHSANSEILRKQLYRHRLKQIRMASTFLLVTVSFVLFYLPSILTAERMIESPIMIYYLYLCTHALNPMIYCFMNISLRAYVCSMLRCRKKPKRRLTGGTMTTIDR